MWENFVKPGAPLEVNISGTQRAVLRRLLRAGTTSPHMFEEARGEVFRLMRRDNFPRFKHSGGGQRAYRTLLRRMARRDRAESRKRSTREMIAAQHGTVAEESES